MKYFFISVLVLSSCAHNSIQVNREIAEVKKFSVQLDSGKNYDLSFSDDPCALTEKMQITGGDKDYQMTFARNSVGSCSINGLHECSQVRLDESGSFFNCTQHGGDVNKILFDGTHVVDGVPQKVSLNDCSKKAGYKIFMGFHFRLYSSVAATCVLWQGLVPADNVPISSEGHRLPCHGIELDPEGPRAFCNIGSKRTELILTQTVDRELTWDN